MYCCTPVGNIGATCEVVTGLPWLFFIRVGPSRSIMVDDGPAKAPLRKALKVSRAEPQETTFLGLPLEPTTTPPPPVAVNHQVQRLKIASLVFGVSLFLNLGAGIWVQWFLLDGYWDPYYFEWVAINGLGEMIEWLNYMFVDAWLIDEYSFWFQERGPLPVLIVILRDLMPFVFIGAFGPYLVKKDEDGELLEKIGMFTCGYAGIMAALMLYVIINIGAEYGEIGVMFEVFFGTLGFWGAVFAGVFLHPRCWCRCQSGSQPRTKAARCSAIRPSTSRWSP